MIEISWAWIGLVSFIIVGIIYLSARYCRNLKQAIQDGICGYLIVDPGDEEQYGGVYLQTKENPKAFKDGDIVHLIVRVVKEENDRSQK